MKVGEIWKSKLTDARVVIKNIDGESIHAEYLPQKTFQHKYPPFLRSDFILYWEKEYIEELSWIT